MLALKLLSFGNSMGNGLGVLPWYLILPKYDIAFFLLNFYVRALDQVAVVTLKYGRALSMHFFTLAINSE